MPSLRPVLPGALLNRNLPPRVTLHSSQSSMTRRVCMLISPNPCPQRPTRTCSISCLHESSTHPTLERRLRYIRLNTPPPSSAFPTRQRLNQMATTVDSRMCHPTATKWILRVTLELVFEDAPMPRKEGNEDEGGESGAIARRQWKGKCWAWVRPNSDG